MTTIEAKIERLDGTSVITETLPLEVPQYVVNDGQKAMFKWALLRAMTLRPNCKLVALELVAES